MPTSWQVSDREGEVAAAGSAVTYNFVLLVVVLTLCFMLLKPR